ncbi:hypothetical protein POM88_013991 [Heracleum sosnowskyi]|uniref:Uncharacterized protein n=1 Tax=Heracleum sosnowskyi TaxID=360622 RepID=A0AAD8MYM2_9APIA|nr:hypothetical protein POM88_013991 [Heracleum sosnowskyi]
MSLYPFLVRVKIKLKGHHKRITGLAFSDVLNVLVSSGADSQLCIWNTDGWEKQTTRQLQIPTGRAAAPLTDTRVQFHQDQTHLIAVHETQIAIYEAPKLECLKQDKWSSAYDVRTILISIQSLLGAFVDIMGKESKITKEDDIGLLKEMQENLLEFF